MADLYEDDILLWSEQQAGLLRRLERGERVNSEIDWRNLVEEVESVGRSQLSSVRNLLVQALLHDLKARAWPEAQAVPQWQAEALGFRDDAAEAYTPSMRRRIDVQDLYRRALRRLPKAIDRQPPLPLPDTCPVTLEELLAPAEGGSNG